MMNVKRLVLVLFEDDEACYIKEVLPDCENFVSEHQVKEILGLISLNHIYV